MGFFTPSASFHEVPGLGQYLNPLANFDPGLGMAGRTAKSGLKQMSQGNYEGIAGSYLNPIKDSYAVSQREGDRALMMGGNAFQQGQGGQPGLMASLQQEGRLKNQEGLGMSLASAIPQLYGQMANTYGQARQGRIGAELDAQKAALQGKIGGNQLVTGPSIFGSIMQGLGAAGGMATGLGAMGVKPCWVAESLWGVDDSRTHLLRHWLVNVWSVTSPLGFAFLWLYLRFGERVAKVVKRNRAVRAVARFVFEALLHKAVRETNHTRRQCENNV